MPNDDKVVVPKFSKDENPDQWSSEKEYAMRLRYDEVKTDRAVQGVRKKQNEWRWSFGMPQVSQDRWDQIFGKKETK